MLHLLALLVISAALAGCQHQDPPEERNEDDAQPISEVGVGGVEGENTDETQTTDDGTGDGGGGAPAEPSAEPPKGELGRGDVAQLAYAFDDRPFQGGQETPRRYWKWITEDTFIGIVLDDVIESEPARVLWIVIAQKGLFCAESQPAGFPHFRQAQAADWESGKGGQGGEQGYWMQHIAVTDIPQGDAEDQAAWGPVSPGVDGAYAPTVPPSCGDAGGDTSFDVEGQKTLDGQGRAMLIDAFDDQPFWGAQASPNYVSKWVGEEAFIFLRFDHPDPQEAGTVDWFGVALRGQACENKRPDDGFTHFHKWQHDRFDEGHHAATGAYGYWMLHAATRPLPGPDAGGPEWGPVPPGADPGFMPTTVDDC